MSPEESPTPQLRVLVYRGRDERRGEDGRAKGTGREDVGGLEGNEPGQRPRVELEKESRELYRDKPNGELKLRDGVVERLTEETLREVSC